MTVPLEARVDWMGPCKDKRLARYKPDAIIEYKKDGQKYMVVMEFTRSLTDNPVTHKAKVTEKKQANQSTVEHLQKLGWPAPACNKQYRKNLCKRQMKEMRKHLLVDVALFHLQ
eukprot:2884830-Rhodomonas_salina.1